jgi:hypothetical protein
LWVLGQPSARLLVCGEGDRPESGVGGNRDPSRESDRTETTVKFERAEAVWIGSTSSIPPERRCRIPFPDLRTEPTPDRRWSSRRDSSTPLSYRARARKLTAEQEAAIRALAGTKTHRSLTVEFGVSHESVRATLRSAGTPDAGVGLLP